MVPAMASRMGTDWARLGDALQRWLSIPGEAVGIGSIVGATVEEGLGTSDAWRVPDVIRIPSNTTPIGIQLEVHTTLSLFRVKFILLRNFQPEALVRLWRRCASGAQ